MSWPASPARGPSWPQPVIRATTMRGLRSSRTSGPRPRRSSTPGRYGSTRTSAPSASRSATSRSAPSLRSRAIERRPRLSSVRRAASRSAPLSAGRSTRTTSAPRSASNITPCCDGPRPASSTTRMPWNGPPSLIHPTIPHRRTGGSPPERLVFPRRAPVRRRGPQFAPGRDRRPKLQVPRASRAHARVARPWGDPDHRRIRGPPRPLDDRGPARPRHPDRAGRDRLRRPGRPVQPAPRPRCPSAARAPPSTS